MAPLAQQNPARVDGTALSEHDHDPGDECDAATQVPRAVARLNAMFTAALAKPFGKVHVVPPRRTVIALQPGRFWLAPHVVIEARIGTGDDHDPGDEDPRVKVRHVDGQWIQV